MAPEGVPKCWKTPHKSNVPPWSIKATYLHGLCLYNNEGLIYRAVGNCWLIFLSTLHQVAAVAKRLVRPRVRPEARTELHPESRLTN